MVADLLLPSNLTVINATPFTWQKTLNESSQIVQWDNVFPDQIEPGQLLPIPLQFTNANTNAVGDGLTIYSFNNGSTDNNFDFSFVASAQQQSIVSINFIDSSTFGNLPSTGFDLGWTPDTLAGSVFILSGLNDTKSCSSTNVPLDWMHQNLPTIGCQPLRRLCIPGSHDSGMSILNHATLFSTPENTLTQWVDIAGQLDAGFRYFDLRPVISNGQFVMGHYSEILDQWVGGNGQNLASIVGQVNSFLADNNELVILDISHTSNTDDDWRPLNNDEFARLLTELEGLQHRYSGPAVPDNDLSSLPLNKFIATSPCLLIINSDSSIALPASAPAGIYPSSALKIFNSFSDTDNPLRMREDQLSKLAVQRTTRDSPMFLLSWTLTTIGNIRTLAKQAHDLLYESGKDGLWETVYRNRETSYPNIIMIDGIGQAGEDPIDNRNVAALSMAINHAALNGVPCPA